MKTASSKPPAAIAFDVYGTLVDPLEMNLHLKSRFGDLAGPLAALWREKQIEYAFRRALMNRYQDFGVCTHQALQFALATFDLALSTPEQQELIAHYQHLSPFPDVVPGLEALCAAGYRLAAFSNGVEAAVRDLLENAGIAPHLEAIISVDDLKTFKPDPRVYAYLADRLGTSKDETCLVSSNAWDVIGARSSGLQSSWIKRKTNIAFDPWDIKPNFTFANLQELAEHFSRASHAECEAK